MPQPAHTESIFALDLRPAYAAFDAELRFEGPYRAVADNKACEGACAAHYTYGRFRDERDRATA